MVEALNIRFIIKSILGIIAFFYSLAHILVYFKIGYFILLSPLGAKSVLSDPMFRGQFFIAASFLGFMITIIFFIKGEYARYKNEKVQNIYKITLEELSKLWSSNKNSVKKTVKEEVDEVSLEAIKLDRSKTFFDRHIKPSLSFFPPEKLSIIIELLKILEHDGIDSPSVARAFSKDPEKTGSFKSPVTASGLTSYDIFYKINLYEHTMNVADEAVKYIIRKDKITYETVLCDAIIVALAHDIGKLGKIKLYGTEYNSDILKNNPHNHISKLFFSESWPGYELIEEAIFSHHSAPKSNALLTRMIIEADKEARKMELEAYMQKNKIQKSKIQESKKKKESEHGAKSGENSDHKREDDLTQDKSSVEKSKNDETSDHTSKKTEDNQNGNDKNVFPLPKKISRPVDIPIKKRRRKANPFNVNQVINEKEEDLDLDIENEQAPKIAHHEEAKDNLKKNNIPLPIEYTDELENNILSDLRASINTYSEESIKGIASMSYDITIFFSVIFVNGIIEKHLHIDSGLNPDERKEQLISITKYIASIWADKGYTDFFNKRVGVTEVYLTIDDKRYKFLSIPLNGKVFDMDAYSLEDSKDQWMRKIIFSRFRQ